MKINETPELLGHTWWWRGGSNSAIRSFGIRDGYVLFMGSYRIKVRRILVQISPIPRFDFIILDIEGEEKNVADKNDYKWMDSGSLSYSSVKDRLDGSNYYFRLPYK